MEVAFWDFAAQTLRNLVVPAFAQGASQLPCKEVQVILLEKVYTRI